MNSKKEIAEQMISRGILPILGKIDGETMELVQAAFVEFFIERRKHAIILISSFGGNGAVGVEIYDILKLFPGKTTGIVIGKAMSAASYILQGCTERFATPNSRILIHNGSNDVDNDILLDDDKVKEYLQENTRRRTRVHKLLSDATGKNIEQVVAECKRDKSMDTEQAIDFGLLDGIWTKKLPWEIRACES